MTRTNAPHLRTFTSALEASRNLCADAFVNLDSEATTVALVAHSEIEQMCVVQKSHVFYRHFIPLRARMVALLADSYRQYFKLALAHESTTGGDPDKWARTQLQPAVHFALEWMRDWYILACDGEIRRVRHVASAEFVPGQTVSHFRAATPWRAPAWLFGLSLVHFGIEVLKPQHVPSTDSGEKLGQAHTRLLLKGARRVFWRQLGEAIEKVRNEETAAAGAIRVEAPNGQRRRPNRRMGWEQRLQLYDCIRNVLSANPSLQGMKFCAELDKKHAPPLLDWTKRGDWREGLKWKDAWRIPQLRRKIRRVRQEAQKKS